MSNILLNNFQSIPQVMTIRFDEPTKGKDTIDFIAGFSIKRDPKSAKLDFLSEIITTILICDKVYIPVYDLSFLIKVFNEQDILTLLRNTILVPIHDHNLEPVIAIEDKNRLSATSIHFLMPDNGGKDALAEVEEKWQRRKILSQDSLNQLVLILSKGMVSIDVRKVSQLIEKELDYDLQNANLTSRMRIATTSREDIKPNDVYKILRLLHINKGLLTAV